ARAAMFSGEVGDVVRMQLARVTLARSVGVTPPTLADRLKTAPPSARPLLCSDWPVPAVTVFPAIVQSARVSDPLRLKIPPPEPPTSLGLNKPVPPLPPPPPNPPSPPGRPAIPPIPPFGPPPFPVASGSPPSPPPPRLPVPPTARFPVNVHPSAVNAPWL